jgi:hypothetical protein
MHDPSSRAPLTHATVLVVVAAGRVPTVAAEPAPGAEVRLGLDVAGLGHGVNVALVGPYEVLVAVVADLHDALLQVQAAGP